MWYAAGQGIIPCLFHTLTGGYCPGCGGTRAIRALGRGQVFLSFCYHPLVLYLAVFLPVLLFSFGSCRKKKKMFPRSFWENILIGGLVLLIGNFLIKNACLLFLDLDLLACLDQIAEMGW